MVTIEDAAEIALAAANKSYSQADDVLVAVSEATIHKSYGWVFFFDSKRHRESNDPDHELAGCSPILVLAQNGATVLLGTSRPAEELLKKWEYFEYMTLKRGIDIFSSLLVLLVTVVLGTWALVSGATHIKVYNTIDAVYKYSMMTILVFSMVFLCTYCGLCVLITMGWGKTIVNKFAAWVERGRNNQH